MKNIAELTGPEKIEEMFLQNQNFSTSKKNADTKNIFKKLKIHHLFHATSFLRKRLYNVLPSILKDIFYWHSVLHKAPASKTFAKTKYDEFRTLLDIKVSKRALKRAPKRILSNAEKVFRTGYFEQNLDNINELNYLIDKVTEYSRPTHAGARPYFKDGKSLEIENSYSAYYKFSKKDSQKITMFLKKNLDRDFSYYLSVLAGYRCELKNISYSLGIVFGENSNSEMHQDTFSGIAKGFIYLQDMDISNSPFEYLEGSYLDANFRSTQTNKSVIEGGPFSSGSTRIRKSVLEDALSKFHLKTFTGKKGLFVMANTSGYHRKGSHSSQKPRITINFEIKRKGVFGKALANLL